MSEKIKFIICLLILTFALNCSIFAFGNEDYESVLRLTVKFYGAQRCGDADNWLLTENPYGNNCHLQDGPAFEEGLNLNGGWHDAGDHIKFSLTTAFSAYVLLKAYDAFPDAFPDEDCPEYSGIPNGIPDVLDEVRIATDFLIQANPDAETMISRVGGSQDHNNWLTSPYQSTLSENYGGGERPVYANAKADICGISTAALALMANKFNDYDSDYADTCLYHAEIIFNIAKKNPGGTVDPDDYYTKTTWKDDMMCGAIELYRTTGIDSLKEQAIYWNNQLGSHGWVVDWSNHIDYGRHSMVKAGCDGVLGEWQADVNSYTHRVSSSQYVNGLAYFGDWGSLRYAAGAAFSAALLYDVTGNAYYKNFSLSQVNYILGENEYERSFIIGFGVNPPTHPHHVNAHGHDCWDWDLSDDPVHVLHGALVGGPTKYAHEGTTAGYVDDIYDYWGNEVSIEYNSGILGALAMAVSENLTSVDDNDFSGVNSLMVMHCYPNPFNSQCTISFNIPQSGQVNLSVYDLQGRVRKVLADDFMEKGEYTIKHTADSLDSGIYFYTLKTKSGIEVKKFVLLK